MANSNINVSCAGSLALDYGVRARTRRSWPEAQSSEKADDDSASRAAAEQVEGSQIEHMVVRYCIIEWLNVK